MKYGILAGVLWAVDTVILSVVLGMEPFASMALSAVISAGLHDILCGCYMGVWSVFSYKAEFHDALKGKGKMLILAAALGGPVGMLGYLMAVDNLGAGYAAVLSVIFPAVGALMSRILLKDRLRWFQYVCMAAAIGCIALILWTPDNVVKNMGVGIFGATLCIIGWASEGVICSYAQQDEAVSSEVALAIREITSGLIYMIAIVVIVSTGEVSISHMPLQVWGGLALAAGAGVLSYLFYYKAIDMLGTARAMSLDMTYSIWTPVICMAFLGQQMGLMQICLTICVIICSVVAGNRFRFD